MPGRKRAADNTPERRLSDMLPNLEHINRLTRHQLGRHV